LEVYNEQIHDLLMTPGATTKRYDDAHEPIVSETTIYVHMIFCFVGYK
jgi:hypothetical protein